MEDPQRGIPRPPSEVMVSVRFQNIYYISNLVPVNQLHFVHTRTRQQLAIHASLKTENNLTDVKKIFQPDCTTRKLYYAIYMLYLL